MEALLIQGHQLILFGRSSKKLSFNQRIKNLLEYFNLSGYYKNIHVVEADFCKPFFGLQKPDYFKYSKEVDQIIHCASDTRFSESHREQIYQANVFSLEGLLNFSRQSNSNLFYYIGTAYSGGDNGKFRNVYEETKSKAESIVGQSNFKHCIIRPSVVIGDSKSGKSNNFNTIYYIFRGLKVIKERYGKIDNTDQKESKSFPLKIYIDSKGVINIITIDYFVKAASHIINSQLEGVYNLTGNTDVTIYEFISWFERYLQIKGITIEYSDSRKANFNPAELFFNNIIQEYKIYFHNRSKFDENNLKGLASGLEPPEMNYEIFKRCMDYAIRAKWKKYGGGTN